jgi:HPr kinase/phosphorylase
METVHGTAVSLNGCAVLIRGAPGSGKSDLALQLIETTGTGLGRNPIEGRLIADDQTELYLEDEVIFARAPHTIAGGMEMRGFGILNVRNFENNVPLVMIVDLAAAKVIARMPEPHALQVTVLGKNLPRIHIDPSHASAAARVRTALVAILTPENDG